MDRRTMPVTSYPELYICLAVICVLIQLAISRVNSNQTVILGIIIDQDTNCLASIIRSVELAASVSNATKSAKINPVTVLTDLGDSFKLRESLCKMVDQQPIALLGNSRSETFSIFESYSRALNIPFFMLSVSREANVQNDNYIVNMYPTFIEAVVDLIKYFQWDRFLYLFDTDDALWRLQKLYQAFSDHKGLGNTKTIFIDPIRIPNVSSYREILRQLDRNYNLEVKRIVVDLDSVDNYDVFMSQIIDVGMNRDGYHYILGTLDIQGASPKLWRSFMFGGVNITGFQLVNRKQLSHRHLNLLKHIEDPKRLQEAVLIVDAVAVLTTALVKIMNNADILRFRRGVLYNNMSCSANPVISLANGTSILQHILNVTMSGLSGTVAFDANGLRQKYKLDIFHLSYRSPLHEVGVWQHEKGLINMSLKSSLAESEIKPNSRIRNVIAIETDPFVRRNAQMDGKPNLDNERFEGYCIDMLETIAMKANFSYRIESVNGGWNGILRLLLNGTADIAIGSITITRKREEVVHFTKPFMNTGISIMIKKPERERPGVFSFAQPLAVKVWVCILIGFLAVSFILYMVGRFSPYECQDEAIGPTSSDTFTFINTLWFSLGALMRQGPDIFPRSFSGRVLASVWWFFTLITVSSYTANMAAFLTFEKLTAPINSVDNLVKQNKIKYGTQKNGSTYEFFQDSNVPIYKDMFNVMKAAGPTVFVNDVEEGWLKVINNRGTYAFLLESSSNDFYNQRKPCKTMKVGRNLDQKGYGIATPKHSDLSHSINIAVLEMLENGDSKNLEEKWWLSKGECGNIEGGDKGKNALKLSNVSGIFHVLIGGLVLSMIISLSQILFYVKVKPNLKGPQHSVPFHNSTGVETARVAAEMTQA